jgi:alpha-L-arabinofuranosidase
MIAGNDVPAVVSTTVTNPSLTVTAKKNGAVMTLEVVNMDGSAQAPTISFIGYTPATATVQLTQISGSVSDQNNATNVTMIQPRRGSTSYTLNGNAFTYSFPPSSFTVLRLE